MRALLVALATVLTLVVVAAGNAAADTPKPGSPPQPGLLPHPNPPRSTSEGAEGNEEDMFGKATDALAGGKPGDAIALFEALADRGVVDENVSFDRGLAYAARVRIGAEQPGDLGRAAHGFEEARALTTDKALERDAFSALAIFAGGFGVLKKHDKIIIFRLSRRFASAKRHECFNQFPSASVFDAAVYDEFLTGHINGV